MADSDEIEDIDGPQVFSIGGGAFQAGIGKIRITNDDTVTTIILQVKVEGVPAFRWCLDHAAAIDVKDCLTDFIRDLEDGKFDR